METRYSLAKSVVLLGVFIVFTPIALTVSVFGMLAVSAKMDPQPKVLAQSDSKFGANIFAALPDELPSIEANIGGSDARVVIVKNYLSKYKSPLEPYSDYIVEMADQYDLDFRLITAIAQQESNLCKVIPEGTYNCWGWGIHSRGTLGFSSYKEGIEVVSRGLRTNYLNKGLIIPEHIMQKYTPLSNGSWAYGVRLFMEEMR